MSRREELLRELSRLVNELLELEGARAEAPARRRAPLYRPRGEVSELDRARGGRALESKGFAVRKSR